MRYTYSNNSLSSPQVLLDDIPGASHHNGCRLFIVGDKLFITTGDAEDQSAAQNIQSLNGKTLRINLDGTIPSDNPFPNNPVWSWGHRNAQGMVYANNMLYQSEHGPITDDEVNIVMKGRNYGWPTVTGFCNTQMETAFCNSFNVVEPISAWTPTLAVCGIDYYNHPMFPNLQNSLLMTTLSAKLYQLKLNASFDSIIATSVVQGVSFGRLRDICIAPSGKIYISTSNSSASGTGNKVDKIIELYDPTVNGVKEPEAGEALSIYPNPTGKTSMIEIPGFHKGNLSYTITDALGKIVRAGKFSGQSLQVNTSSWATGSYQVKIIAENGKVFSGKIMKQ